MDDTSIELPFLPIRSRLYSPGELFSGFDPERPDSLIGTPDFQTYRYFRMNGGAAITHPYAGMMEALHDHSVLQSMLLRLKQKRTVAIMGGHDESRDTLNFANVVDIARKLAKNDCRVASGGGPGAMEATHLGALLAFASDSDVQDCLNILKTHPSLRSDSKILDESGNVNSEMAQELHSWLSPAFRISQELSSTSVESIAIPTWYYGHEPTSPFATEIAKYFQNSIREDILLSIAANGLIFTPGSAGTLQEVFQEATMNYYPNQGRAFAPMIFLGKDFWTNTLPVIPLLYALFVKKGKKISEQDFDRFVCIVDTTDEAVDRLLGHNPSIEKVEARMVSLGFKNIIDRIESGQASEPFTDTVQVGRAGSSRPDVRLR